MYDDDNAQKTTKTRSPKGKIRARCPACNALVTLRDNVEVWDIVTCPECQTVLEVVDLRPPTLDYANDEMDGDSWEEDDEDWEGFSKR
jgi:lysine biosynthesis protein LysW